MRVRHRAMTGGDGLFVRPYRDADRDAVVALWQECGLVRPWNDPDKDIARKQAVQPEWFLVVVPAEPPDAAPIASAMMGYDGHRGWVNYLAVSPAWQRRGVGARLMAELEQRLTAFGGPKLSLQVRASNRAAVSFYERLGYRVDDVISLGKRLIDD
ncbi:MAG: GNAT family acetyltransferase [Burkholderiaceae bacterium]